jgi:cyclopropane fatty-acyl-phospholipid synthase-like methyltransferase
MKNTHFDNDYRMKGMSAQRSYPNTELISFVKQNYKTPARILEIGCGSGANMWFMAKEGHEVCGTDYSLTALKLCEEMMAKWDTEADLVECDMTTIPFMEPFDAIVDVVSMQHLDIADHQTTYKEVWNHLKKGGKFFSYHLGEGSVIARKGLRVDAYTTENVDDASLPLANNGLMTFLSTAKAEEMLVEAGFKNVHIEKVTRSYDDQRHIIEYLVITAEK